MAPDRAAPHRRYTAFAVGLPVLAALGYLGVVDPHRPGSVLPGCPLQMLTGWYCPACGGLRMLHDLLHADLAAAVTDNAFLLVAMPAAVIWLVLRRPGSTAISTSAAVLTAAAVTAWTVLRNLPGFPLVPTFLSG